MPNYFLPSPNSMERDWAKLWRFFERLYLTDSFCFFYRFSGRRSYVLDGLNKFLDNIFVREFSVRLDKIINEPYI